MRELKNGVYLEAKEEMIENQKTWDENDLAKETDFTTSNFWMTTDNGIDPIGFDSELEARNYLD